MYYDDDADLGLLDGKTVAIIGFGSQGHAHALNLKDSGVDVVVGLRSGSSSVEKAKEGGLEVLEPADAASRGDIVQMLVPDELHRQIWEGEVRDGVAGGNLLLFRHGVPPRSRPPPPPAAAAGSRPRRPSTPASWPPRARAPSCAASTSRARASRAW